MDYKSIEHITLNGKTYTKEEVLSISIEPNHLGEVFDFLNEWFSESIDILVQTSGSTGTPKQIAIPKQSFVESAMNTCNFLNLNRETNALLCIPVKYIGGKMMVIRALVAGYNLWIEEPSSSPLSHFEKPCDFLAITPMQADNCLAESPEKFTKINHVIIGGGAVSQTFIHQVKDYTTQFYSTYGMTETVSHIAMQRLNGTKKSEVFELLPTYSVSLNNENCLVIDCPTLFPNKVTTNDVAQLFPNGFKWLGRKDNVINSGGIKLSPEAIESKIKKHHPELTFYITSKKDDALGEKVILVSEKEIQFNFSKMELDKYQIPKEILIETITRTETGKIKRKKF